MVSTGVSKIDPEGSRKKRASNRDNSIRLLGKQGFRVEQKSDTHFHVFLGELRADFWPTTGQYCVNFKDKKPEYKRGVFSLMKDMRKPDYEKPDLRNKEG